MPRSARIELGWSRSLSTDVAKQEIKIEINGAIQTVMVPPEVESYLITVEAQSSVSFSVDTFDEDGQTGSIVYSFSVGDLEAPLPATDLFHRVVAIIEPDVPADI